jgi:hypothetical protein
MPMVDICSLGLLTMENQKANTTTFCCETIKKKHLIILCWSLSHWLSNIFPKTTQQFIESRMSKVKERKTGTFTFSMSR